MVEEKARVVLENGVHADSGGQHLESFSYDDRIVRMFALATLVWGVVAFLVGLIVALLLVMPQLSLGLPYLTFGRLRPLHTNAAIFAFAGNAVFAAVYYSTQRLCKARMWSDLLSHLHFWGWQLIIVAAALTLPLGITQSKEYAELEWPIDIAIAVVWVGFFGVNFFMTLIKRRERHMYVAIWFYIATIVTVAILHVFNNLVVPAGWFKSYPIYAGVQDAFMQWWYGHNAVAFFLTTPFLGLMYYFLPKAAERPVFSYKLSIVHFWSIVFIYIWAGPHHLHYTATPPWAQSLGMVFSLMLWMPSWGGMINGLLTLRGAWHRVATDPVLKFFVIGITFYGMSTFEGPMLSIKSVNSLSHYTDWTIAHVHSGALGWNGFMTFGMLYWLLPRIFQTKLYSVKLATWHFWVATIGMLLYIVPIYVAGLTQGLMWRAFTPDGSGLLYGQFIETVRVLNPMWWARAIGGSLYLFGALLMGYNYFMTWRTRPKVYDEPVFRAAPLSSHFVDPPKPQPRIDGVLEIGKKLDVWEQFHWHRIWERLPVRFTVWVTIAVVVASAFEMIPTFMIRTNIPQAGAFAPYTPLELYGRDVYIAEGCYNCHSQMIRPMFAETERYGDYSKPHEFVHDRPFQWGSRRIGPDLAREGKKQSNLWHIQHFWKPEMGSPMPSYQYLFLEKSDFNSIPERIKAVAALGSEYAPDVMADPVSHAKAQARWIVQDLLTQNGPDRTFYNPDDASNPAAKDDPKKYVMLEDAKVIALIAYMQRLGQDASAYPPVDTGETKTVAEPPSATATVSENAAPENVSTGNGASLPAAGQVVGGASR